MAVASLVLGIIGLILNLTGIGFVVGGPLSLISMILGIISRKKLTAENAPKGVATAGMALGISGLVVGVLLFAACSLCAAAMKQGVQEQMQNDPQFRQQMEEFNKQIKDNANK